MRLDLRKIAAITLLALLPVGCGPEPVVQPAPSGASAPSGSSAPSRDSAPSANPGANPNMPPADPAQPAQPRTGTGVDVKIGGGKGVDVNVDPNRPATNPNDR